MRDEDLWNKDLIEVIKKELNLEFPNTKIVKGKVLKDLFLNKNQKSSEYKVQFGFVDQDIVIYDETMDITDFHKLKNIIVHNNTDNKNQMIIPKIICELKYDGITSHGLIIYSEYASDIKSIFPECDYWLALRFRKSSTVNKLYRHGKKFDKIIFFDKGKSNKKYEVGDFEKELNLDGTLKKIFDEFISEIKKNLRIKETNFIK